MKLDVCMWGKDGAKYLPVVFKRIDDVIPAENIKNKIFVDDSSRDSTVEIAKEFGWTVYKNAEGFVAGGTREALRHVETEFFVSVEQDIILARDWFDKIPMHIIDDTNVIIAQGIRVPTNPILKSIAEFRAREDRKQLGYTLDNNIYRTALLQVLGGFPNRCPIFVDQQLWKVIRRTKYEWVVDETVVSDHIRESLSHSAEKDYKQKMLCSTEWPSRIDLTRKSLFRKVLTSPLRGLHIGLTQRLPQVFLAYPYISLMEFKTYYYARKRILEQS